jgi:hypothetical protein
MSFGNFTFGKLDFNMEPWRPTLAPLFRIEVELTVLDEEAVLEELGRARPAAELRPEGLGHVGAVLVLEVGQQNRVLGERFVAEVALVQMVVLFFLKKMLLSDFAL